MRERLCGFLAMQDSSGWSIDMELGIPPLAALGWRVELVPWRDSTADWNRFDLVYIGTPWDYPEDPGHFLAVLAAIDASRAVLVNDLSLVRWNLPKTYLRELAERGAGVVPGRWLDHYAPDAVAQAARELEAARFVLKPVIGSNARDTFLLSPAEAARATEQLATAFGNRPLIVQPYIEAIETEGEYSLFYLGGELSHSIVKTPRTGDFRVQEEHGASIRAVSAQAALVGAADRVMALVHPAPAYGRCDLVRGPDGRFLLMELELIEPSLYLRMDACAPRRFAAALDRYFRDHAPGRP